MPRIFLFSHEDYQHTVWSIQTALNANAHTIHLYLYDEPSTNQVILPEVQLADYVLMILPPAAFQQAYQLHNPVRQVIETALAAKRPILPILFPGDSFSSPAYGNLPESIKAIRGIAPLNLNVDDWNATVSAMNARLTPVTDSPSGAFNATELPNIGQDTLDKGRKAEVIYERGARSYLEKNFEEAQNLFTQAIVLLPTLSSAYNNRALIRRRNKDLQGALDDMNTAIRLKPNGATKYANRALIYMNLKQYSESMADSTKAIELNPEMAGAYFNRAQARQEVGDLFGALQDYQVAIRHEPEVGVFHLSQGILLEKMNQALEAAEAYDRVLELDSTDANAIKRRQKLFVAAINEVENRVKAGGSDQALGQLYDRRGQLYYNSGIAEVALNDFNQAIRHDNTNAAYYLHRGNCYRRMGEKEQALENYDRAIALNPRDEEVYFSRADTLIAQHPDHAMTEINHAIELNSRNVKYYQLRAVLHAQKQDHTAAITDYSAVISMKPTAFAYLYRGIAHAELKDFEAAITDIKQSIALDPNNKNAQVALMNIERMAGENQSSPAVPAASSDEPPLKMPGVDDPPITDLGEVFTTARERTGDKRFVAIVTPGRLIAQISCPPPGSMPANVVNSIEQMAPSSGPLNVTVIANNDLEYVAKGAAAINKIIPFFGYILGLAYIGHNVLTFEGHPTALAIGCKNANLVILDDAMIPLLQPDWLQVVLGAMNTQRIMIFKRNGQLSVYRDGAFS
jgi:tetratricopeptide (TPR) repeat protein